VTRRGTELFGTEDVQALANEFLENNALGFLSVGVGSYGDVSSVH
jgi:hypothetical protein